MSKLTDKPNYGYDTFSSSIRETYDAFALTTPPEFQARLKKAMDEQLPVKGAVRDPDGIVHEVVGNFTLCDLRWVILSVSRTTTVEGWFGWNILDTHDVDCLECIGDPGE
jgi:hypothetical protein